MQRLSEFDVSLPSLKTLFREKIGKDWTAIYREAAMCSRNKRINGFIGKIFPIESTHNYDAVPLNEYA